MKYYQEQMDISGKPPPQPPQPPADGSSMLNNNNNNTTNRRSSTARRRSSVIAREHVEQVRHSLKIRSNNNLATLKE